MASTVRKCMISHIPKPCGGTVGAGCRLQLHCSLPLLVPPFPMIGSTLRLVALWLLQSYHRKTQQFRGGSGTLISLFWGLWKSLSVAPHWTFTHISLDSAVARPISKPITGKENGTASRLFRIVPKWNECWGVRHIDHYIT